MDAERWPHGEAPTDSARGVLFARLRTALANRYRIERELGRGAMARVYLAYDRKHQREVAIKVLRPDVAVVIGSERFLREIRIAARLNHPHIVPLHDSGAAAGLLYYVMPNVEGESLRTRVRREGQLPLDDAVQITREVADALAHAHNLGIIHRDVKPENILLSAGHALVADFGIARALAVVGSEAVTESGVAIGTPAYMSPEQAAGSEQLDARSDIYSLGCVLYEMLAGRPPFTGTSAQAVLAAQMTATPTTIVGLRRDTPSLVAEVIHRALAKDPGARVQTATELRDVITPASSDAATRALWSAASPRAFGLRSWQGALGLGLVILGAVAGRAILTRSRAGMALDPNLLAVAPFDVFDARFELWREGLVDYLSKSFDGAGPLRTVAPTVVLQWWHGPGDPVSAGAVGRRTGAHFVLFGQVVGTGTDSARVRGTVVDAATEKAVAEFERSDVATRFDRLADSLAVDVLRSMGRIGPQAYISLPSLGTRSWPALKAFLRGEQLLRRFSLDSAIRAYEEAVDVDDRFALALRRLGLVRGWRGEGGGTLGLAAGRFNHGLAPRDSLLIVADSLEAASDDSLDPAYWSHRVRKFAVLEEASRRYPDDPEVWYGLGEARFHLGYVTGTTAPQTIDAFSRAIALDASFAPAYVHLVQLALDRNDTSEAQRYISAYTGLTTAVPEGAGIRVVRELIDPIRAKSPRLQSVLDTAKANVLFDAWRAVRRWPDGGETGVRLLRLLAAGRSGVGVATDTTWARYLLVTELLYRGHLREARAMVGSHLNVPFAELAIMGVIPPDSAATAFDGWLGHPDDRVRATDPPWVARCYRSFLAAEWWIGRRDTLSLLGWLRHADAMARASRSVPKLVDARADISLARAALALARRDTADALQQFISFPDSLCAHFYGSLSPSLSPLQVLRLRLLAATGRDRDAARVFDQQVTMPLTAGSILATLERGRIAERLQDPQTATRDYQFVADVWRNADPELRPYTEEAIRALKRLGATRGP